MLRALLAGLTLALPVCAQQIWTVDDNGPADFVVVQDAIDAAADGDTILVRDGSYGRAVIDGKGLIIQGEGIAVLSVFLASLPIIEVRNLAADQAVHIRHFDTLAIGGAEQEAVVFEDCDGPVLMEDCDIDGFGEPVVLRDCVSATFVNCELVAPGTFASYSAFSFFGFASYAGLVATDSNVFLYDCLVRGSSGGNAGYGAFIVIPPGPAGLGVGLRGSTMLASGCTFSGGNGGGDPLAFCFPGEDGAPGLELSGGFVNPDSTARLIDCVITGGSGGVGGCGLPDGVDAPAEIVTSGQIIPLPGSARSFRVASPAHDGSVLSLKITGDPGDEVILHVSDAAVPGLFLAPYNIALHMNLPVGLLQLGALPPDGTLDIPVSHSVPAGPRLLHVRRADALPSADGPVRRRAFDAAHSGRCAVAG